MGSIDKGDAIHTMGLMSPIAWLSRLLARSFVVATVVAACSIGQPAYGDTIDGIACDGGKNVTFQATISLWLVKGNQRIAPTSGVGSTGSSCNYWVRTEDEEGVVHIRAPHEVRPTLATFLAIWDRTIPLGSGNATEFRTAAEQGRILVNGQPVAGGAAAVQLVDGSSIELRAP